MDTRTAREQAGLPSKTELEELVLDLLRKMDRPVKKAEVGEAVASALGLSETQRALMDPQRRMPLVDWHCGFALSELNKTGFAAQPQPRSGIWTLTESGRHQPFQQHLQERQRLAREARWEKSKTKKGDMDHPEVEVPESEEPEQWPVKRDARSALNTILYGPPGTGKTYATFRRCVEICDGKGSCPDENSKIRVRCKELVGKGRIEFVTFHQSYGYEEFVEGLRPDADSAKEDGVAGAGFRLVATPGVLKRIANRARGPSRPTGEAEASADTKPHVLVIDEINRANVSKVMGELITLLEEDKREGAGNEVAVTLPHSGERFTLPANLYILGTMNTADRSIALLDTALRRRFEFEELAPDPDLLGDAAEATDIDLPAVLLAINERLEYLADRDHLIGHAWLMGAHTKADVDRIMRHKIIPLIAEYFYDDWQKVRAVLGGTDDFVQGKTLNPPPGLDDTDASEDRRRWTVRDEFEEGAYDRLIAGQAQGPE